MPANLPSRRDFLQAAIAGAAGAACAPGARVPEPSQPSGGTGGAWDREWEQLVASAKKEGKLVVMTLPGTGYTKATDAFQKAFPGIEVEHTTLLGRDFAPRMLQERKAGLYHWDIVSPATTTAFTALYPEQAFDPIRPLISRPDITDDQHWFGGWEFGFLDRDKKWAFGFGWNLNKGLAINTDLVKDEIKSVRDILDPKWRGKIASADPRSGGASATPATVARLRHGQGILKQIFVDQAPTFFNETRQGVEWLVRGSYPMVIGISTAVINDFRAQGLARNVKQLVLDDFAYINQENIWLANRAPHPNAAKLYVNWLLSKEGQATWSKELGLNSRRTDVPPADLEDFPPEGAEKKFYVHNQQGTDQIEETRAMVRELLK